jgi:hypothetical protein
MHVLWNSWNFMGWKVLSTCVNMFYLDKTCSWIFNIFHFTRIFCNCKWFYLNKTRRDIQHLPLYHNIFHIIIFLPRQSLLVDIYGLPFYYKLFQIVKGVPHDWFTSHVALAKTQLDTSTIKWAKPQLLCPFQKGKDFKLEIEMACNYCTKVMV